VSVFWWSGIVIMNICWTAERAYRRLASAGRWARGKKHILLQFMMGVAGLAAQEESSGYCWPTP